MPAEKLKPCPFCGGNVKISEGAVMHRDYSTATFGGNGYSYSDLRYSILCGGDGCFIQTAKSYSNKDRLIAEWNRRADIKECARQQPTTAAVTA